MRMMASHPPSDEYGPMATTPQRYEFRVRGHLGEMMRQGFPDLNAETRGADTLLSGSLPDHSALHGVLAQIEALGLELIGVRQLPGVGGTSRQNQ